MSTLTMDPSKTLRLRQLYHEEMQRKFAEFIRLARDYVTSGRLAEVLETNGNRGGLKRALVALAQYAFPAGMSKAKEFKEWTEAQIAQGLLQVSSPETMRWMDMHIYNAYKTGLQRGAMEVSSRLSKRVDSPAWTPLGVANFTEDRWSDLRYLLGHNYEGLKDISHNITYRMTRELTDGIAAGTSPETIATAIESITDVPFTRALLHARTEIVRAHHVGTYRMYEELGVGSVDFMVELATADDKACAECKDLEGRPLPLSQTYTLIPVHPLCRCCMIPSTFSAPVVAVQS